jgi:(E)-4-hydroxy-3-methylbut-2-enyl-diphosphate synthase
MREIESRRRNLEDTGGITVAVMGCNVNGPGEAREADIGIAGGRGGTGTIFTGGRPVATLSEDRLLPEFQRMVEALIEERMSPDG